MRYRPPSKRGRPSFIPTPKPIAPRTAPPHVRNRRPPFSPPPFKNSAEDAPISKAPNPKKQSPSAKRRAYARDKKGFTSR